MAMTISELQGSRKIETGDNPSATLLYRVKAADFPIDTELAARDLVNTTAPASYDGLSKLAIRTTRNRTAGARAHFDFEVLYGLNVDDQQPSDLPETGEVGSWSTRGKREKLLYGLEIIAALSTEGTGLEDGAAINIDDKGRPQGIEIIGRAFAFHVRQRRTNAQMSNAYRDAVMAMTPATNDAVFRGHAIGEVLFVGAEARQLGPGGDWDVDYEFWVKKNLTGQSVGDFTGISKKGWEVLDVKWREALDTTNDVVVPEVYAYSVLRAYPEASFTALGIATS